MYISPDARRNIAYVGCAVVGALSITAMVMGILRLTEFNHVDGSNNFISNLSEGAAITMIAGGGVATIAATSVAAYVWKKKKGRHEHDEEVSDLKGTEGRVKKTPDPALQAANSHHAIANGEMPPEEALLMKNDDKCYRHLAKAKGVEEAVAGSNQQRTIGVTIEGGGTGTFTLWIKCDKDATLDQLRPIILAKLPFCGTFWISTSKHSGTGQAPVSSALSDTKLKEMLETSSNPVVYVRLWQNKD